MPVRSTGILTERKCIHMWTIPNDPVMLLSFVNLKLRDYYADLGKLCEDLDIDETELIKKLAAINYDYDPQRNQFV